MDSKQLRQRALRLRQRALHLDSLAIAKRRVKRAEEHVAKQITIIKKLDRGGYARAAGKGRELLVTFKMSLDLARACLHREREKRGMKAEGA